MKRIVIALTWCLAACGGEPVEKYCEQLAAAECGPAKACGVAASDASCDDITNNSRADSPVCGAPLLEAVKKGTVRYDGNEAKKCVDALTTQCRPVGVCDKVFTGTVAVGGACTVSQECESTAWCDRSSTCPGACTTKLGAGAKVPNVEACSTNRVLLASSGDITCLANPREGDACAATPDCSSGLSCRDGRCAPGPKGGEPCDGATCAIGFRCTAGTCLAWAKRGEACANESSTAGAPCQAGLACRDGVCGDALREGESCDGNSTRCGAGLQCKSSTCTRRGEAGASCRSLFDCDEGLWCDGANCFAKQGVGGPCMANGACELGLTCTDGTCGVPVCAP